MINIELLDYKYDDFSNNQVNFSLATTNQGWTVVSQTKISISTTAASTSLYPVTGDLAEGSEYEISLTLSNKTGTGDIGFSTWGSDSSNNGIPITMRRSTSGSVSGSFTAVGVQGARILAETGTAGDLIATITQKGGINWNESVAGSLDVGDSEDFPLAMSFSVSEARNLNSRTGTYSKTFKIPATKNNNKILKYSYNEGYHLNTNTISNQKQCRITVDGNLSIVGTLQVTAIGKATEPLYYSCVFYGNNVDWASSINNKLLKDLSVNSIEDGSGWDNLNGKGANTGVGLKVIYEDIKATWDVDDAVYETPFGGSQTTSTSPIVYPLVGYGENNQGGAEGAIQLLKTASQATGYDPAKIGYFGFFNDGSD